GAPTDAEIIATGFVPIIGMQCFNAIDGVVYLRSTNNWILSGPALSYYATSLNPNTSSATLVSCGVGTTITVGPNTKILIVFTGQINNLTTPGNAATIAIYRHSGTSGLNTASLQPPGS